MLNQNRQNDTRPFTKLCHTLLLNKCAVYQNKEDGVYNRGGKIDLYGCTTQKNRGAAIRIADDNRQSVSMYF